MSRNPYLAASRPASSYTRSSRTSKRSDVGKGSLLGRSRSSASLGGGLTSHLAAPSSSYGSSSSYVPSTGSWQRSSSSTRLSRPSTDPSTSYKASDYIASSQKSSESLRVSSIYKSASTHNFNQANPADDEDDSYQPSHLKNYQQSKFQQSQADTRSPLNSEGSVDTRRSTTSIDSSATDLTYDDSESIRSGSAPRHLRSHGQLLKSHSLDIGQQPPDAPTTLAGSMSVDRLLLRSESMSERELRKSYKELVMEFERVRRQLKGVDDREKQKQQDWIRRERQLQRKISELEEENRQLDHWKQEVQRLKDENTSLVRVVSKLSKQN